MADVTVDLRSDLLGPRSERVAQAVSSALSERPTLNPGESPHEERLLSLICEMLGAQAGVFVPTCTMANQMAVRCWLPDGGTVVADMLCHLFTVEQRALQLTGVEIKVVESQEGHITPEATERMIGTCAEQRVLTWLENTHNLAGGSVMPTGWQDSIGRVCSSAGVPVHLDGSRLWNAAAASNVDLDVVAGGASSVAISLNKAVGAPMGAILAGPKEMIEAAIQLRVAMSGDWRPIGPMAAGALAAIDQWRQRLLIDHQMTLELATMLKLRLGDDAVSNPTTNLIMLRCPDGKAGDITTFAAKQGTLALPIGRSKIRLAVHAGLTRHSLIPVAETLAAAWEPQSRP